MENLKTKLLNLKKTDIKLYYEYLFSIQGLSTGGMIQPEYQYEGEPELIAFMNSVVKIFRDFRKLVPFTKEEMRDMCVDYRVHLERWTEGEDVLVEPIRFINEYCKKHTHLPEDRIDAITHYGILNVI